MSRCFRASRWIAAAAVIAGVWVAGYALAGGDRARITDRNVIVLDDDDGDAGRPRVFVAGAGDVSGASSFLGVNVEEETDLPEGGARVLSVIDGSPAEAAGLEDGDVIVAIDGRTVRGPAGLRKQLEDVAPGTDVRVDVIRNGQPRSVTAKVAEPESFVFRFDDDGVVWDSEAFGERMEQLGERLGDMDFGGLHGDHGLMFGFGGGRPKLGVELVSTTPELREHLGGRRDAGVLVGRVLDGMPAEAADIRVGDLIEAVDGEPVGDAGDLVRELRDSDGGTIVLDVVRDRRRQQITVAIPAREDEPSLGPRATIELPDLDGLGHHIRRAIEDTHRALERLHEERPAGDDPAHPAGPAVESAPRRNAGLDA